MPTSAQLAKLTPPRLGKVVLRRRLFEKLDTARKEHSIIWISSPAGSGKTTLVNSYLQERKLQPLWYQVDEGDQDLAGFFHYLSQGLKSSIDSRIKMPVLTPEYQFGIPVFTRNYFRELFSQFEDTNILVFDNYQDAGDSALLNEMLPQALEEIPPGMNVIIISRSEPPSHFARLRNTAALSEVDWSQLQLTADEEYAIAVLNHPDRKIDRNIIKQLNSFTHGWVTGLILLLEQRVIPEQLDTDWMDTRQNDIFNYFSGEVLRHADIATHEFLLKSAILPKMNVALTRKLTGINNTKKILADLAQRHFFTHRHGIFNTTYEYHPLFREFLLNQAREQFNEDELRQLQAQAGQLLAEANEVDSAVKLLQNGQNWPVLSRLLEKHAAEMIEQGRHKQLEKWITSLPGNLHEKNSWLQYRLGECKLQFAPIAAREHLIKAYSLFTDENDSLGAYLAWSDIIMSYFFALDEFGTLTKWMDEFYHLRARWPKYPNKQIQAKTLGSLIPSIFTNPNHPIVIELYKQAETLYKFVPIKPLRAFLGTAILAFHHHSSGDFTKMLAYAKTMASIANDDSQPPIIRIMAGMAAGTSFLTLPPTKDNKADEYLKLGINISEQSGIRAMIPFIAGHGIYVALLHNDISDAEYYADLLADKNLSLRRIDMAHYYKLLGNIEIKKNNYTTAQKYLDEAYSLIHACNAPPQELTITCMQVLAGLYNGDQKYAQHHFRLSQQLAEQLDNIPANTLFNSIVAVYAHANDETETMLAALRYVFANVRIYKYTNFINFGCTDLQTLCTQAIKHDVELPTVSEIIKQYGVRPKQDEHLIEAWPYAIRIYTLGRFRIVLEEETLLSSGKSQKKPVELLKALIIFGGRDVPHHKLTEDLWPDVDGDAAYESLRTTVKRLRSLLKHKEAVIFLDGKLSLNPQYCWVDSWAFERGMGKQATEDDLVRALALYQGNFLGTETDTHSVLAPRERLRRKFIDGILRLGRMHEANQQWQAAIEHYLRGIDVDELTESLYQRLMHCYARTGQMAEVEKSFQRCQAALDNKLGIAPSSKTIEGYEKLIQIKTR